MSSRPKACSPGIVPPIPPAIDLFHHRHPRFLDEKIKWRPKFIPHSEIRDAALSLDDARLTIARYYEFADWPSLTAYVEAVSQDGPFFELNRLSRPWLTAISPRWKTRSDAIPPSSGPGRAVSAFSTRR